MTLYQWLGLLTTVLVLALLLAAGIVTWRRRRSLNRPSGTGWLTDDMIERIIRQGRLSAGEVPDEELDFEEIAREEDRFWSESWDEPEAYWE